MGEHFFRGDFTGQLYLDVDSGRLFDDLIDEYQWRMLRLEGFDLGGEAWLTFRDGQLQQVTGSVRTPYLQLGVGHESLAPLEDIRARFGWRRHHSVMADEKLSGSDSFALGEWHIKQLQWTWNGDVVSPFSLRLAPSDGGMSVIADALPLAPTRRLASRLPILPEPALRALRNYRPGGFLTSLKCTCLTSLRRNSSFRAGSGMPVSGPTAGHPGSRLLTALSFWTEIAAMFGLRPGRHP